MHQFPLTFKFKVGTLSNDFSITDANNTTVSYVRQKMFKLKEDILCYSDESKANLIYRIKANKWIDYSATYTFSDANDLELGRVARKGRASLWKATYEIFNLNQEHEFTIKEVNPWAKLIDALLSEIPIVGIFTGYMFNPKYLITDKNGQPIMRLSKNKSFLGKTFTVDKIADVSEKEQERIILSLMMMILLERRRG
jgi:uncharacterized protein YxjI